MSVMQTLGRVGVGAGSVMPLSMERMSGKQMRAIGLATLALALLAPVGAVAQQTEVSANAGWVSQYFYRGIFQKTSSASAGLDLTAGALSLGTWLADVGDGTEVDFYGSVGVDVEGFSLSARRDRLPVHGGVRRHLPRGQSRGGIRTPECRVFDRAVRELRRPHLGLLVRWGHG